MFEMNHRWCKKNGFGGVGGHSKIETSQYENGSGNFVER